ncbi:MAG TPA: phosphate signaling complex protein PhoU [Pontiellaceae bacterium]|nr:phosphate signaling complex protein PhoU [Pontiellaceae bacterium]HPR82717.1 phosphate signaling complex protein PhoU [Pontiellaceae bacterium]
MSHVFMNEVERLKKQILSLSAQVEESLILAVKALLTRDEELANQVIRGDFDVDQVEVEVEEEALKILALYQPVAMDLRFLTAVLKINSDLERIGDLATNIAKRAVKLCKVPAAPVPEQMTESATRTRDMVHDSLNAFVCMDAGLARAVCGSDDRIDDLCRDVRRFVEAQILKDPAHLSSYLDILLASRNIERIGDHATNIAEDVIYLVEGIIVRHRPTDRKS